MTWADYAKYLLAICIWREARGEEYTVKLAVAYSILTRAAHPSWWGHNVPDCIAKAWQYSSMTGKGDANLIKWPVAPDSSFDDCMRAVEAAISNSELNPCPDADSYYDISIQAPNWASDDKFIGQVGRVKFYKVRA